MKRTKSVVIKVRMTESEKQRLAEFAERSFISMSDIVRISINKFTKHEHTVANQKVG